MKEELNVTAEKLAKVQAADRILFAVHFGDDVSTRMEDVAKLDCLKIVLINRSLARFFPNLKNQLDVFDMVFWFDGPGPNDVTYGNLSLMESNDSEILIPSVYNSVCTLLDQILPVVSDKDSFYLSTIHEEIIVQMSLIRKKYGLKLGLSPEAAKLFVSKSEMKKFFTKNGFATAAYAEIETGQLLRMDAKTRQNFVRQTMPPFPVVVKPVAGAGSFETYTLKNEAEFADWLSKSEAYKYKNFLVEEKLQGPQSSYQVCVTKDGIVSVNCDIITDEGSFVDLIHGKPLAVKALRPARFSEDPIYKKLEAFGRPIFEKAGALDHYGVYFMDVMRKGDGGIAILEMAARCMAGVGGNAGQYYLYGFDIESYALAGPFLCDKPLSKPSRIQYKHFLDLLLPSWYDGKVTRYNEIDPKHIKAGVTIVANQECAEQGETVSTSLKTIDYIAQVILLGGDDEQAVLETGQALKKFHDPVQVEPA